MRQMPRPAPRTHLYVEQQHDFGYFLILGNEKEYTHG